MNSSRESLPSIFLSICRNILSVLFSGVDSSSGIFITVPTWDGDDRRSTRLDGDLVQGWNWFKTSRHISSGAWERLDKWTGVLHWFCKYCRTCHRKLFSFELNGNIWQGCAKCRSGFPYMAYHFVYCRHYLQHLLPGDVPVGIQVVHGEGPPQLLFKFSPRSNTKCT